MCKLHGGKLVSDLVKPEFSIRRGDDVRTEKGIQRADCGISGGNGSLLLDNANRRQQASKARKGKNCFVKQILVPEAADIALYIIRKGKVGIVGALVRAQRFPFPLL